MKLRSHKNKNAVRFSMRLWNLDKNRRFLNKIIQKTNIPISEIFIKTCDVFTTCIDYKTYKDDAFLLHEYGHYIAQRKFHCYKNYGLFPYNKFSFINSLYKDSLATITQNLLCLKYNLYECNFPKNISDANKCYEDIFRFYKILKKEKTEMKDFYGNRVFKKHYNDLPIIKPLNLENTKIQINKMLNKSIDFFERSKK